MSELRVKTIFINGATPGMPSSFTREIPPERGIVDIVYHSEGGFWEVSLMQGGALAERWVIPQHLAIVCLEPIPKVDLN